MKTEIATFALGCFWAPDDYFSKIPGVVKTTVGYSGGSKVNPTYHDLGDHTETVEVEFDPDKVSYGELLDKFFMLHNPTIPQVVQYRSAIFFHDDNQKKLAVEARKKHQKKLGEEIVTAIEKAGKFWPAEEYHQKYYKKNNVSGVC